MSITQSKFEAFFKEFPWLSGLIEKCFDCYPDPERYKGWTKRLTVQRLDLGILKSVPYEYHGTFLTWRRIFILGKSGNLMQEVPQRKKIRNPQHSLWRPSTWAATKIPGQELADALVTLPNQDFKYVLCVQEPKFMHVEITIYKLPTSFSLQEWIEKLQAREESAVQRESMLADWDGQSIAVLQKEEGFHAAFYNVSDDNYPGVWGKTATEALGNLVKLYGKDLLGLDIKWLVK